MEQIIGALAKKYPSLISRYYKKYPSYGNVFVFKKCVVKICEAAHFRNTLQILQKLSAGITPPLLKAGQLEGYYYLIFARVHQSLLKKIRRSLSFTSFLRECGHVLGKFHQQTMLSEDLFPLFQRRASEKGIFNIKKQEFSDAPVLIHGDIHYSNFLLGSTLYLIDFDLARPFDPYYDLCSFYVFICRNDQRLFMKFFKEYQKEHPIIFSRYRFEINLLLLYLSKPRRKKFDKKQIASIFRALRKKFNKKEVLG